jgi:hypothetical protein
MLQSFIDEFNLLDGPAAWKTPATPGGALVKAHPKDYTPTNELLQYRLGDGKLLK